MISLFIYQAIANTAYLRLIRVADGGIVHGTTGVIALDTSWANSSLALSRDTAIGGVPVTIPTGLKAGDYDMLIYDEAATPANTDVPVIVRRIAWAGNKLVPAVPISIVSI